MSNYKVYFNDLFTDLDEEHICETIEDIKKYLDKSERHSLRVVSIEKVETKMKYYETDFCREEQIIIDKLREKGYFVYGLRDGEGDHYTVEPKVIVNNIGFVVTDKPIKFHEEGSRQYITDTELREIGEDDYDEIPRLIEELGKYFLGYV